MPASAGGEPRADTQVRLAPWARALDGTRAPASNRAMYDLPLLLVLYVFWAYSLHVIADRTGTHGAWMAWLPGFQFFLLLRIAGRSITWLLWLLVPGINLLALTWLYADVAAARGRPMSWAALPWIAVALAFATLSLLGMPVLAGTITAFLGAFVLLHAVLAFA